jgi:hypothetical protein
MILRSIRDHLVSTLLFSNCGKQITDGAPRRIWAWDEWPGPEDPKVYRIHERLQALHDEMVPLSDEQEWQSNLDDVVDWVQDAVPYDENADAWHAPNSAAWQAAWTLLLQAWFERRGVEVPADLKAQYRWFVRGHWPCALDDPERQGDLDGYVVY